jgi:photosystem II stability/assembly factor-like uncharacterized protein
VIAGLPDLRGLEWPADNAAFAVGGNGGIWKSTDGGASWTPQTSGTAQKLNAVRFRDASNGWAVGANGVALKTVNGGANWSPTTTGTTKELFSIDYVGSTAWAVGAFGTALKTANAGGLWTPVDLKLDSQGDVKSVWLDPAGTTVTLTGGGGFLRSSSNGGTTWTWAIHPLIAPTSDYFQVGSKAWLSSSTQKAVAKTADGTNWTLPFGVTTGWDWQLKLEGPVVITRGNTFATSPQNRNAAWVVIGQYIFKSLNRGDTWALLDSIPNCVKTNSFCVSPKDSTHWVAAVGTPDRIVRTLNSGGSWTATITKDFSEYGMPIEMHPDKPDTFFFAPEDGRLYRSKDFCATWDTLSIPGFRSPCDIVVVPGDDSKIVVGDGCDRHGLRPDLPVDERRPQLHAQVHRAELRGADGVGQPRREQRRVRGELVERRRMEVDRLRRDLEPGLDRELGVGRRVLQRRPKAVAFNRYAGVPNYLSTDQGASFQPSSLTTPGSGYAMLGLDRSTWLDLHSFGVYKLAVTQAGIVEPPSRWRWARRMAASRGTPAPSRITWDCDRSRPRAPRVPGEPGRSLAPDRRRRGLPRHLRLDGPNVSTGTAEVRVSDAWDAARRREPTTCSRSAAACRRWSWRRPFNFNGVPVNYATWDTLHIANPGSAPLTITKITSDNPRFTIARSALTIPLLASDSLSIWYKPNAVGPDSALITFTDDTPQGTHTLRARGTGVPTTDAGDALPIAFALEPNVPNPFALRTTIRFALPARVGCAARGLSTSPAAACHAGRRPARGRPPRGAVLNRAGSAPASTSCASARAASRPPARCSSSPASAPQQAARRAGRARPPQERRRDPGRRGDDRRRGRRPRRASTSIRRPTQSPCAGGRSPLRPSSSTSCSTSRSACSSPGATRAAARPCATTCRPGCRGSSPSAASISTPAACSS